MKKYVPFLFPAIALLIVLFLGFRWYSAQTAKPEVKIPGMAEGVKIDNLSADEMKKFQSKGAKDLSSVELKGTGEVTGQVRYEVKDGKIAFTVNAAVPQLTAKAGFYQVWLNQVGSQTKTKAFVLEYNKGGYLGSASVSADMLPFEVTVSKETKDDAQLEAAVLTGTIQK